MNQLQLTFAIIKPHITSNPVILNKIQNLILTSNFQIIKTKRQEITLTEAKLFYEEHRNKFFYNRLITFMLSGPCEFYILAKTNAIEDWRRLMGPTKVFRAQFEAPDTIRGQFGLSDTRNATHGSSSIESVRREIKIFFPKFNIDQWYQQYQSSYVQ